MSPAPTDERPHVDAAVDEWVFGVWRADGSAGFVSGHRLVGKRAWYWFAVVEAGRPMLHLTEWNVAVRADPFVVKAPEMWAEHHCVDPLAQWTIGNEGHAVALDDPDEAFGRAYGTPTPIATDVEWYALRVPEWFDDRGPAAAGEQHGVEQHGVEQHGFEQHGFEQHGVAHGVIELLGRPNLEFDGCPAQRWRRWGAGLGPVPLRPVFAHTGLRAGFSFPDGSSSDWVVTRSGWRRRSTSSRAGADAGGSPRRSRSALRRG